MPAGSELSAGSRLGNYHIVRKIGGGGMAQIYLAKTQGLAGFEKHLALKVINREYADEERFVQMLIDEAKITVGLSHVNIAQVFDLGQVDGIYYIAMEFVDGVDILQLVNGLHASGEKLPIEAVAFVARQMCSGLHYAHTRQDAKGNPLNIVHRDISPQNILVSRNGEVKVVDFGIAKAAGVSTKTQAGVIKGKVNYMAPEQALGQKADCRTDVFAAGIVMWEMLTSQMVYSGNNVADLVVAVRKADIAAPSSVRPDVPARMDAIVRRALAPRAADRYQNAHELQVDLTKFLSATAPDYGAAALSDLVEQARGQSDSEGSSGVSSHLSRNDVEKIGDRHSVLFGGQTPGARLVVRSEHGDQVIELEDALTIGRAAELVIADARVSRQHARVFRRDRAYVVEDLGSANGTFVNEVRITAPVQLQSGDRIRIGSADLIYGSGPAPSASLPESRIIVGHGDTSVEYPLNDKPVQLGYQIRVGETTLRGHCAQIRNDTDGCWLEPQGDRIVITIKGVRARRATRLNSGDAFEVSGVSFRFEQKDAESLS